MGMIIIGALIMMGCSSTNEQDIQYSPCRKSSGDEKANQIQTSFNGPANRFVECENDSSGYALKPKGRMRLVDEIF